MKSRAKNDTDPSVSNGRSDQDLVSAVSSNCLSFYIDNVDEMQYEKKSVAEKLIKSKTSVMQPQFNVVEAPTPALKKNMRGENGASKRPSVFMSGSGLKRLSLF